MAPTPYYSDHSEGRNSPDLLTLLTNIPETTGESKNTQQEIFQRTSVIVKRQETAVKPKKVHLSKQLKFCSEVLKELIAVDHRDFDSSFFDSKNKECHLASNYDEVVKHPMDLVTVKNKLEAGQYKTAKEFAADVRLIFSNCYKFYGIGFSMQPATYAYGTRIKMARMLHNIFETRFAKMPETFPESDEDCEETTEQQMSEQQTQQQIPHETEAPETEDSVPQSLNEEELPPIDDITATFGSFNLGEPLFPLTEYLVETSTGVHTASSVARERLRAFEGLNVIETTPTFTIETFCASSESSSGIVDSEGCSRTQQAQQQVIERYQDKIMKMQNEATLKYFELLQSHCGNEASKEASIPQPTLKQVPQQDQASTCEALERICQEFLHKAKEIREAQEKGQGTQQHVPQPIDMCLSANAEQQNTFEGLPPYYPNAEEMRVVRERERGTQQHVPQPIDMRLSANAEQKNTFEHPLTSIHLPGPQTSCFTGYYSSSLPKTFPSKPYVGESEREKLVESIKRIVDSDCIRNDPQTAYSNSINIPLDSSLAPSTGLPLLIIENESCRTRSPEPLTRRTLSSTRECFRSYRDRQQAQQTARDTNLLNLCSSSLPDVGNSSTSRTFPECEKEKVMEFFKRIINPNCIRNEVPDLNDLDSCSSPLYDAENSSSSRTYFSKGKSKEFLKRIVESNRMRNQAQQTAPDTNLLDSCSSSLPDAGNSSSSETFPSRPYEYPKDKCEREKMIESIKRIVDSSCIRNGPQTAYSNSVNATQYSSFASRAHTARELEDIASTIFQQHVVRIVLRNIFEETGKYPETLENLCDEILIYKGIKTKPAAVPIKSNQCKHCMNSLISTVYQPCGHRVACYQCSLRYFMDGCLVCHKTINSIYFNQYV